MARKWFSWTYGGNRVVVYDQQVPDPRGLTIHGRVAAGENWIPFAWDSEGRAYSLDADTGSRKARAHPLDLVPVGRAPQPERAVA